jgi:pilus assembly protein CpaC
VRNQVHNLSAYRHVKGVFVMIALKARNRYSKTISTCGMIVALGSIFISDTFAASSKKMGGSPVLNLQQGNTSTTQFVTIPVDKAAVIKLPDNVRDVIVANPDIIDAVVRTSRQVYLFAKKAGQTNAFFFTEDNRQILNLEINVGWDNKELERIYLQQMPSSQLKVTSLGDNIILSGSVRSASHVKLAKDIATRMTGSPDKVVNNISISGQEQVTIKVKVAEMQRTILKQLGIDWNTAFQIGQFAGGLKFINGFGANGTPLTGLSAGSHNNGQVIGAGMNIPGIGSLPNFASTGVLETLIATLTNDNSTLLSEIKDSKTQIKTLQSSGAAGSAEIIQSLQNDIAINNQKILSNNQALIDLQNKSATATKTGNQYSSTDRSIGYTGKNASIDGALKALERHNLIKTLAEPTLTALSGESAKFLAGGEIPYIVNGTLGQASVDFKPYGVGLAFTPMVLSDNRISLKVSTEVSDLSSENVVAANSSYPGIAVRRAETTVEMPSGGSIVMAGLIQENTRRALDSTPGVKEIPVLGPLFKSNDFKTQESELIILATPYLVEPAHLDKFKLPTDGFVNPSDADLYLAGNMAAVYGKNGSKSSNDKASDNQQNSQSQLNGQVVE